MLLMITNCRVSTQPNMVQPVVGCYTEHTYYHGHSVSAGQ